MTDIQAVMIGNIISIVALLVSIIIAIFQMKSSTTEQIKTALSQKRPLIIGSMYAHMDLKGKNRMRKNFTRYITKTAAYKEQLKKHLETQEGFDEENNYAFVRIRNESDNHAHGVKIKIHITNTKTNTSFFQEYTINIIASFCEYMIFVPQYIMQGDFFDKYKIEVTYSSVAGEKISYTCEYDSLGGELVVNKYKGIYAKNKFNTIATFSLVSEANSLETIENPHNLTDDFPYTY